MASPRRRGVYIVEGKKHLALVRLVRSRGEKVLEEWLEEEKDVEAEKV